MRPRIWGYMAAAGIAGSLLRYGIGAVLNPQNPAAFPWGTLTANLLGCLLLGWLTAQSGLLARYMGAEARAAVTTGFVGAFTTFSALGLETVRLLAANASQTAAVYVAFSVLAGLAAVWCGAKIGGGLPS
ncbi:fluoride efflux transporter CrcB [Paenibacillus sp. y28]|uniref:fluoride efflux transporter CrcB n=1 Tax=Paenibacillus sp. y28 TaxID=3129110 RepID=UPI00301763CE